VSDFDESSKPDNEATSDEDGLVSRLRVIEDQPLESRAAAFAQIHEELQSRLESGDTVGHGA
jgi:hypothetical protein